MAPWTTVTRRHKDPGNKEKGQEGQGEEGATMGAHEGVSNRFTGKIRPEFAVSGRIGKFNAVTEAKKLFGQMIRVDEEIVFKSDIDGRITFRKISEFPTGENKFKEFFTVTPHTRNDGTGKIHINFQIESKKRLAFLKRDVTFFNYLRENKIWLVEHKYETHSLQSIGFIVKKSPSITHRPQLETDIGVALNEYMETAIDEGTGNGINLDGRAFIPTMEIVSKHVVHVLRDGNQNRTGVMETHALEIRCERNKAEMLGKLLTAADLPENKFGKFVPYGLAKTDTDVYKKMIKVQNQYMADIVVIPVFGLHKDVLESVTIAHVEGWGEDDSFKKQMMEADSDVKDADSGEIKNEKIFLGIEPTQRTDDLGKWFFLTTKQHEESANKMIDEFLIDVGSTTGAYKNHFNDGDSFMRGIRRANRPSAAFQSYAQALRNDMEDEDDKSDDYAYYRSRFNTEEQHHNSFQL